MTVSPTIGPKDNAAALTPYKADAKTKEAARTSDYFALVVDHDDDNKDANAIRALYGHFDVAYLAWTSSSHMQEKGGVVGQRWKVLIPFSRPVDFERYTVLANGLALMLGTDKAQANVQQVFFAPNIIFEGAPYEAINTTTEAPLLDPMDDADALVRAAVHAFEESEKRKAEQVTKAAPKPRTSLAAGQGGIIDKVCQAYDLSSVLESHGYQRFGSKYLSPHSSTGNPGMHILPGKDGKERVYSHHGASDPLSNLNHDGHCLDVFDVLCTLDHAGDVHKAVAALAAHVDPDGQRERQRAHMEAQEALRAPVNDLPPSTAEVEKTKRPVLVPIGEMLKKPKPVSWLIRGIIEANTLGLVFGESGAGKSYVVLDMAFSVANGAPWHDHEVTQGPVVYVAGEGHGGLARRLLALSLHRGIDATDSPMFISRKAVLFAEAASLAELVVEMDALPVKPVLIVIDTLARATVGLDENSAKDMGAFIQACDDLKHRFNCTVLVVHHAGLGDKQRARGSSAIKAALDAEIGIRQQDSRLLVSCTKQKDGPAFPEMTFRFIDVPLPWKDEHGDEVVSSVLEPTGAADTTKGKSKTLTGARRIAMDTLRWCLVNDGSEPPEALQAERGLLAPSKVVAEDVWRDRCYAMGISDGDADAKRKAFSRARTALMDLGMVSTFEGFYFTCAA